MGLNTNRERTGGVKQRKVHIWICWLRMCGAGNELSELREQAFTISFEITEMIVRNLFLFHKLFMIFNIYNARLHMCDSSLTWN